MAAGLPSARRAIHSGAEADIAAAKKIEAKIGDEFAHYGVH